MKTTLVEPKRPVLARVLLYGALLLVAVVIALPILLQDEELPWLEWQWWYQVDWDAKPEVRLLQDYVRIDTTHETGSEVAGAEWLAAKLAEVGVEAHIERLGDRHANLWAVLEGERREAIVLHHHIDVDEIRRPEDWRYAPFGAELDPPWIYGRGVFDMKSVAVAHLIAFRELARSGVPLERSIVFLATSSEETGSDLGTRWILRQHPELVERFGVVLTEGGAVEATALDEVMYWGTEFAQKGFATLSFCSADRERLEELRELLDAGGFPDHPLRLTEPVAAFLERYAPTRALGDYRELLADLRALLEDPRRFRRLPPFQAALFRDELHVGRVEAADGGYRLRAWLHLLPGSELDEALARLVPEALLTGVAVHVEPPDAPASASPLDHPALLAIHRTVADLHPRAAAGPYFLPWTMTDARFFRQAGIPAYGFTPFLVFALDTTTLHGPNERIAVPGYVDGVELTVELLRRLATDEEWQEW